MSVQVYKDNEGQKYKMEYFWQQSYHKGDDIYMSAFYLLSNDGMTYIGRSVSTDEKKLTWYIILMDGKHGLLLFYLCEGLLDELVKIVEEGNVPEIERVYPNLVKAIKNDNSRNPSEPSLYKVPAPTPGHEFWCTGVVLDLDFDSGKNVVDKEDIVPKIMEAFYYTVDMVEQLSEPFEIQESKWEKAIDVGKQIYKDYRRVQRIKNIINLAVNIGGSFFGISGLDNFDLGEFPSIVD